MHGRPQFLFSSGIQCSVCFALLESSMHWTWPTQRHPFFIVVSHSFCPAVFLADSCQVTFSILLRQDAVILFNCPSVTITCCNSTATCAPVSSLTAGINSRFISLHQLTGKIPENSVTKVTKCRRQSYCDKSSVSRLTFSSRLQSPSVVYFTSQPHFFTWMTPGTSPNDLFWYIKVPFVSLARVKLTTSKSLYILTMVSTSQPMTCCPQVRRGRGHVTTWNFGKKVAISQKSYNIATCLQWVTIEWSHFVFHMWSIEWWHCPWPWVTLSHISETTKPISFKLGIRE